MKAPSVLFAWGWRAQATICFNFSLDVGEGNFNYVNDRFDSCSRSNTNSAKLSLEVINIWKIGASSFEKCLSAVSASLPELSLFVWEFIDFLI